MNKIKLISLSLIACSFAGCALTGKSFTATAITKDKDVHMKNFKAHILTPWGQQEITADEFDTRVKGSPNTLVIAPKP